MKSSLVIALAAVAAMALPGVAFAASTAEESTSSERTVFGQDTFTVEKALADRGINAERVEEWGSLVRAFVVQDDGKVAMQFFDAHSLQAVN
ncbi:hypothetical protein VW29_08080 [Devosia limi DSM 17137]|uniref:PepSY domain-containing protein n=1 Tax=Devosia limi DSM 17137 TaxID=1121477 RepID=A0A0F5LTX6_9HYPH|nr:hypothetical protein [Devosia limi]KKB85102.1 hypothetical protein VW29_08080 [Devosia limi DSM 17137]SHF40258.1 hypothetical protein SAMN02745223_02540 [Devosia limi DSM 17137]